MMNQHPREAINVCISSHDWQSSDGDFQAALLCALERKTGEKWRVVCANIMVECSGLYRTLVVSREVLADLREQQCQYKQNRDAMHFMTSEVMFRFNAEIHLPLNPVTQIQTRFLLPIFSE